MSSRDEYLQRSIKRLPMLDFDRVLGKPALRRIPRSHMFAEGQNNILRTLMRVGNATCDWSYIRGLQSVESVTHLRSDCRILFGSDMAQV